MSFEGPGKKRPSLEEALARLGERVKENERFTRRFETEKGYAATLQFFPHDRANLTLHKSGVYSVFEVTETGVWGNTLRGPDDEVLNDPALLRHHQAEAERLFADGKLTPHDVDDDGQYKLDV
jgi:hypothetical protein